MATSKNIIDKRYEDRHKEERKAAHAVWGTSIARRDFEALNRFLKENGITKVALIYAGWAALQKQVSEKDETNE